jgi:hypothetical protein
MGEANRRLKGGFMNENEKKMMPPEIEALAKDMASVELHLVYVYHKDHPFDGEFKFAGPFGRKSLCYMILESAKLFIKDFDPAKQQGAGIIVAKGFPGFKGGGRG